jgi:hypothetical protein
MATMGRVAIGVLWIFIVR